jgi:CelD/BcsL family acetyltransferase involved in cellulose biosynthesis
MTERTAPTPSFASAWISAADAKAWDDELARFPAESRDVYFEREYLSLYASADRQAWAFVYSEGAARYFLPFLLQAIPSKPGSADVTTPYGYGGPIVANGDAAFAARAHRHFQDQSRDRGVIAELLKFHPLIENHLLVADVVGKVVPVCPIVYVDLALEAEHRWQHVYTHANRKNINKAQRSGVAISMEAGDAEWAAFRRLYADTMRANDAAEFYWFSDEYFAAIRERLADNHRLVTASHDGRIVAALLVLMGPRFVHCHLIGTDREAMALGTNNLLHHELILWASAQGFERLMIGGGRGNEEDDSLLRFKRNFSTTLATFRVGESVLLPERYHEILDEWQRSNPDRDMDGRLLRYRN